MLYDDYITLLYCVNVLPQAKTEILYMNLKVIIIGVMDKNSFPFKCTKIIDCEASIRT